MVKATRFDEIVRMFARWGFIETPLKASQINQLIDWKWNDDSIYQIGCDCHGGFKFREAIEFYKYDFVTE